jgi:hypothetical protein
MVVVFTKWYHKLLGQFKRDFLLRDIILLFKFFRIEISFLLLGKVIQNMLLLLGRGQK